MFSKEDIRDIAVQIEQNAERSYRQAAEMAADPKIAATLLWMADQEKEHVQRFSNMAPFPNVSAGNRQLFEMGRELLLGSMQNQTFSLDSTQIAAVTQLQDLLDRSIEFENDTILFYEMLRGFTDETTAVNQLEEIILEERKHIETIRELIDRQKASD